MNKTILVLFLLLTFGCGDAENSSQQESTQKQDLDADLARVKANQDTKNDAVISCGTGTCSSILCGYDCSTSGQQCVKACSTEASGKPSVSAKISGGTSKSLNSDDFVYERVFSLNNVLYFGCDLWDYSSGERDDLVISFREVLSASFQAGGPRDIGSDLQLEIRNFEGPGSYQGIGYYSENSAKRADEDYFVTDEGCGFEIEKTEIGISGTIVCRNVPNKKSSASIAISAEFQCGGDALDPQIITMNRL